MPLSGRHPCRIAEMLDGQGLHSLQCIFLLGAGLPLLDQGSPGLLPAWGSGGPVSRRPRQVKDQRVEVQ